MSEPLHHSPSSTAPISLFYDGYYYATLIPIYPHLHYEFLCSFTPTVFPMRANYETFRIATKSKHQGSNAQNRQSKDAPQHFVAFPQDSQTAVIILKPAPFCLTFSLTPNYQY